MIFRVASQMRTNQRFRQITGLRALYSDEADVGLARLGEVVNWPSKNMRHGIVQAAGLSIS